MKPITIEQLGAVIGAEVEPGGCDLSVTVTGVSTDTRSLQPGDCFVAIAGPNHDGHDHIGGAIDKGAVCVIASKKTANERTCQLIVADTIKAMGVFAKWYRDGLDAKVIAITGSAGKTTTRHILHHVLSQHYRCHQSPKSFNNNIGLPLTLLAAEDEHDVVIVEIGANNPGEIAELTEIAQPDIAIVTNVGKAHLEGFGTLDTIVKEKAAISRGLTKTGKFIINGDHEDLVEHCKELGIDFTTFGTVAGCDIRAERIETHGLSGALTIDGHVIEVPLPGRANLLNTLAAFAVCMEVGISANDFAEAIRTVTPPDMRMDINTIGRMTIINDCYNANPASMANAIGCLSHIAGAQDRRSVFIAGTMGELGTQSEQLHGQLGAEIAKAGIGLLLAVGEFAETLAEAAKKVGTDAIETHIFENSSELCNKLQEFVQPDDIILVKGSRSARLETAVEKLTEIAEKA